MFSPGDPAAQMQGTLEHLRRARDPGEKNPDGWFEYAMYALIALEVSRAGDHHPDPDRFAAFRKAVVEELTEQSDKLSRFAADTDSAAERARDDGWYRASLGRSALQLLADDYLGADLADLLDPEWLPAIDDTLRAAAPETPPLAREAIPAGLPGHHWWWRLPSGKPHPEGYFYDPPHEVS